MAKKNIQPEPQDVETGTGVAIIEPSFTTPAKFEMPSVEESIVVIAKKRTENKLLVIDGVDDRTGYEAVKAGMAQMKNDRIAFVNAATENVIEPATSYLKKFKEDLEKIATEFKAGEQELREKKDFIDNEKVRIKAEQELEKLRKMQLRVNDLNVLGAVFDGMLYSFPYSEEKMITAGDIKELTDEEFDTFLASVRVLWDDEQARKQKAEQERIDAENERLLEKNRMEQQEQKNKLEADALIEKRTKLRVKELKLLGYCEFSDDDYIALPESGMPNVHKDCLIMVSDIVWDELIYDLEHFVKSEDPLVKEVQVTEPPPVSFTEEEIEAIKNEENLYNAQGPQTVGEMLTEVGLVEVNMRFFYDEAYTDIQLTKKLRMRVYPDVYEDEAIGGLASIGAQGKLQNLNWVILPV